MFREPDRPLFAPDEVRFLRDLSPHLAEGTRLGLLVGEATDPEDPEAPGLVVLREDGSVESLSPGAARWLAELPGGWEARGELPPAVAEVAGRTLRAAVRAEAPSVVAPVRVRSRAGRWLALHGAAPTGDDARRVAVIVEPARAARISSLLSAAYGLTERERDVALLVLRGHPTAEIAARLAVVPHVVRQHLKGVCEKAAVRGRRQLVDKLFWSHYLPRVDDNAWRAREGRPLRGGPLEQRATA
jgi:DNA-binding CsgD family transcriptional regulator